jgi:acetylornithine deacetylase
MMETGVSTSQIINLLKDLIRTPSQSGDEDVTKSLLTDFLKKHVDEIPNKDNNIWVRNKHFNPKLPTILLNSHHDTVKPNAGWKMDPYAPNEIDGKLFGLGSNDAGGSLVSLLATFLHFYEKEELKYNLIYSATAEEETSGDKGIRSILPDIGEITMAIVG